MESHPLRMRGLKPFLGVTKAVYSWSHPLRMRGLKLLIVPYNSTHKVASFTDAWIETRTTTLKTCPYCVASFTDAWIETKWKPVNYDGIESHPLRMRGLKHPKGLVSLPAGVASFTDAWIETLTSRESNIWSPVASFTDAWIETKSAIYVGVPALSHPLRMRGLKHDDALS